MPRAIRGSAQCTCADLRRPLAQGGHITATEDANVFAPSPSATGIVRFASARLASSFFASQALMLVLTPQVSIPASVITFLVSAICVVKAGSVVMSRVSCRPLKSIPSYPYLCALRKRSSDPTWGRQRRECKLHIAILQTPVSFAIEHHAMPSRVSGLRGREQSRALKGTRRGFPAMAATR